PALHGGHDAVYRLQELRQIREKLDAQAFLCRLPLPAEFVHLDDERPRLGLSLVAPRTQAPRLLHVPTKLLAVHGEDRRELPGAPTEQVDADGRAHRGRGEVRDAVADLQEELALGLEVTGRVADLDTQPIKRGAPVVDRVAEPKH